ncbi:hypothetical protein ScPMuIL_015222 [Solemya velum]
MYRTYVILACVLLAVAVVLSRRPTEEDCISELKKCLGGRKRTRALIMRCNGKFAQCLLYAGGIQTRN